MAFGGVSCEMVTSGWLVFFFSPALLICSLLHPWFSIIPIISSFFSLFLFHFFFVSVFIWSFRGEGCCLSLHTQGVPVLQSVGFRSFFFFEIGGSSGTSCGICGRGGGALFFCFCFCFRYK